ncbi:MAG TPA: signal recognition particle-docking protein FtsY [Patescibacteria group bacterium]|nr:signal recognition particle-docking protein FtsY [Patescibacteria group bacterium]
MFRFFKRKQEAAPAAAVPIAQDIVAAEMEAPGSNWRDRLRGSLLGRQVSALFSSHPRLDDDLLDQLETSLLTADVGVQATTDVLDDLRKRMQAREFADVPALFAHLRRQLVTLLRPIERPLELADGIRPFVLLVVGVNGAGKTTTIGKLAKWMKREGLDVMLAAGDTFRAAAVEQLRTWGDRNQVPVISQGGNADSASVIYDALAAAKSRQADVLIADTAGRLHTQAGLMDELAKVKRVMGKLDPTAPHETLLVIDGNTGQNALNQARQFHQAVGLTGLVVTKLDGTAKGGVVFALAREVGVPIRFIGVGEGLLDLRVFDAEEFVDGLLPSTAG